MAEIRRKKHPINSDDWKNEFKTSIYKTMLPVIQQQKSYCYDSIRTNYYLVLGVALGVLGSAQANIIHSVFITAGKWYFFGYAFVVLGLMSFIILLIYRSMKKARNTYRNLSEQSIEMTKFLEQKGEL